MVAWGRGRGLITKGLEVTKMLCILIVVVVIRLCLSKFKDGKPKKAEFEVTSPVMPALSQLKET